MITNINTIEDVKGFARLLVAEGSNFHPDDDFTEYVSYKTGELAYSPEEAKQRNELMDQCFEVCETAGEDVYAIMGDIFLTETGMSKFTPLSTSEAA